MLPFSFGLTVAYLTYGRDEVEVEAQPMSKTQGEAAYAELDPALWMHWDEAQWAMDGPWMGHGWPSGGRGTAEATLDFGLFTSRPGFVELLVLCIPVFWVTLLAMSPGCNKPWLL
jgi:hypothetical protein